MGGRDFTLNGDEYSIPLNVLGLCVSAFQGMELPRDLWVVGDVFLRKFYSIYDLERARVGLALAK